MKTAVCRIENILGDSMRKLLKKTLAVLLAIALMIPSLTGLLAYAETGFELTCSYTDADGKQQTFTVHTAAGAVVNPTLTIPAGQVFVDGSGVGDVGSIVLRDRKHLAQDGLIVIVATISAVDGSIVAGPDIISRGFVYVRESEELMAHLRDVTRDTIEKCNKHRTADWSVMKTSVKNNISRFIYDKTNRNPMILPIIMEV